jgi:uncharacterized protein YuzE
MAKKDNRSKFLDEYFFPGSTGYDTKEVGEWVLVRQDTNGVWTIAIYKKEDYLKSREYFAKHCQKEML